MDMEITFPGGVRVDATFGPYTVRTDQPTPAGEGSAPSPFATFLASLGTCAGFYVLGFCRQRGIPAEGIRLIQRTHTDRATGMVAAVDLEIQGPAAFPEKYRPALVRAAETCAVKKLVENPPSFNIVTQVVSPSP
jgi:ribosomal protein S12 methylthiotransferase accessory factor